LRDFEHGAGRLKQQDTLEDDLLLKDFRVSVIEEGEGEVVPAGAVV